MATMGRALNAHKIWGRSYVWFRLWVDLAQIRGLFVGVDRGRYAVYARGLCRSALFCQRAPPCTVVMLPQVIRVFPCLSAD